MAHDLVCWKCGASRAALTLPLRRLEECPACHAELHVCRMCRVRYASLHCREPTAEEAHDMTHANFCDHFKLRLAAYVPPATPSTRRARNWTNSASAERVLALPHAAVGMAQGRVLALQFAG